MNTLKVRIALLPTVDSCMGWMIQITEPMFMIPEEYCISYNDVFVTNSQENITEILKSGLLEKWKTMVQDLPDDHEWKNLNKVELIKCDLMVPKVINRCVADCDGECMTCRD